MTRKIQLPLFLIAALTFAHTSQAQPTITSSDIMSLIGTTPRSIESDTSGSITVNVGSAGASQNWDFSAQTIDGVNAAIEFLTATGTPFASDFPTANYVQKLEFGQESTLYTYHEVTSNAFSQLGIGIVSTDPDTSFIMERSNDVAPLPLEFEDTWTATTTDTTDIGSGFVTVNNSTTNNTVDGWGNVQLPVGEFACLRIREESEMLSETLMDGSIVSSDTTRDISYAWISPQEFLLVSISSQPGETDPNFTEAASISRLTDTGTSVDESREQLPESLTLLQNYPNPFNPETVIRFQLSTRTPVEVTVYNLLGQKVRTLVDEVRSAGEHRVKWNGRAGDGQQVPGGVYLYRLRTDTGVETRKMILLR